jgi:hypothetical protein
VTEHFIKLKKGDDCKINGKEAKILPRITNLVCFSQLQALFDRQTITKYL